MGLGVMHNTAWLDTLDARTLLLAVVPVWAFGALFGMLLPRPKWLQQSSLFLVSTPPGSCFRRFALLWHGAVILRELYSYVAPTVHAYLLALAGWLSHPEKGFQVPQHILERRDKAVEQVAKLHDAAGDAAPQPAQQQQEQQQQQPSRELHWYVTDEDLALFQHRVEKDGAVPGAGPWEHMMEKQFSNFTYTAWRRILPDNKTEYKSVTVAYDSTAQEFMDFYLDDPTRPTWDSMISHHETLENGPDEQRCQVVRWIRTFPFSFIKQREYVIGRRMWRANSCLYAVTKAINHPRAPPAGNIVRMDDFYSMWRSRTIPDPRGNGGLACETVLLHHEMFKIPERLARFAVRAGMAGFVSKMGPAVEKFVAERRQRVQPFDEDPQAFGTGQPANPPLPPAPASLPRSASGASNDSLPSTSAFALSTGVAGGGSSLASRSTESSEYTESSCDGSDSGSEGAPRRLRKQPQFRRFGLALLATAAAIALKPAGERSTGSRRRKRV